MLIGSGIIVTIRYRNEEQTETFEAELVLRGDGQIQGLNVPLTWDPAVVTPVSYLAGPLMADQGGSSAVLSPADGVVDAVLATLFNSLR